MQNWKLASFDLDGTLIPGTSSALHLANKMGCVSNLKELEDRYANAEITGTEFGNIDAMRYRNHTQSDIVQHLEDVGLIRHISETIKVLDAHNIPSVICTLAWDFIAEHIAKKTGVHHWSGASLEVADNGKFTGKVEKYFHDTDKVSYIENLCDTHGIAMSNVFHVGDSRSDFPLFEAVGHSIALNGTEQARLLASVSLESDSLLDVLKLVPGWKPDLTG